MKKLWICLLGALLMPSLATAIFAQEVKVPFLFTEDEKLPQTDVVASVPKSSAVQADTYLNGAMTRLEYMLTLLEAKLNSVEDTLRHRLTEGFEKQHVKSYGSTRINGFARYSKDTGKITAGYRIDGLGRPQSPMRTTCDKILSDLGLIAPQRTLGFLYHDTVLGVLLHEDVPKYTPVLETFANSIVHKVILISQTESPSVTHVLICQRNGDGSPIQYERHSH